MTLKIFLLCMLFAVPYMLLIQGFKPGGVDFSMSGVPPFVPIFESKEHALEYAAKVKWYPPFSDAVIAILYKRLADLNYDGHDRYVGWTGRTPHTPGENIYRDQYEYTRIAVIRLNFYKANHIRGNPKDEAMVGSSVYMGEEPQ